VDRTEDGLTVRHLIFIEVAAVRALGLDRSERAGLPCECPCHGAAPHVSDLGEEVRLTLVSAHLPRPLPPLPLRLQPIVVSYRYACIYAETVIAARDCGNSRQRQVFPQVLHRYRTQEPRLCGNIPCPMRQDGTPQQIGLVVSWNGARLMVSLPRLRRVAARTAAWTRRLRCDAGRCRPSRAMHPR
jgi:hypothetical protein